MQISGAELFVKALKKEKVDVLFAYPGGQAIDLFNALYGEKEIEVILPRHEQGLAHMADGYARSTGKVGVCLVTSGPGATNLVTGIATANYDSVPLVCFTGQVPTHLIGNDAFQEVDIVGITRSISKYAITVRKREELAKVIKKAFYIAKTGKPGVVVVDIPKDIQQALGSDDYPTEISVRGYKPNTSVHIGQMKKAWEILKNANKPVFLIGGGVNIAHAGAELTKLVELTGVPVVTTIMGKGAIPTTHKLYIGNIGIHGNYASNHAICDCDVLFSIGTRFNAVSYTHLTLRSASYAHCIRMFQASFPDPDIRRGNRRSARYGSGQICLFRPYMFHPPAQPSLLRETYGGFPVPGYSLPYIRY